MADTAVNFWPKGATMLDRIIKKDWGLMVPVKGYDSNGESIKSLCRFIARADDGDCPLSTSIHRHSCASSITVISGRVCIRFDGDFRLSLQCGEHAEIPEDVWHALEFPENDTLFIEEYDHTGDDYPIERHEGEEWPDE